MPEYPPWVIPRESETDDALPAFAGAEEVAGPVETAPVPAAEPAAAVPVATVPAAPAAPAEHVAHTALPVDGSIPNFAEDARTVASFDASRDRFERAELQAAEEEVRSTFQKRRELLQAEIRTADSFVAERQTRWKQKLEAYGQRFPALVERGRARKPPFLTNVSTFGAAGRLYREITTAADELANMQTIKRRKEHEDEELDTQLKRKLAAVTEQLREQLKSPESLEKFLARPGNRELARRVEAIKAERAAFAARLQRGEVPPAEQRDREFARLQAAPLAAPFSGVAIVGVETFGDLTYFTLRDRERQHFHLAYDPRLEPLGDTVFDAHRIADRFEITAHKRDGKPMTLLEHLTEFYRDEEEAREVARKVRALLRVPRRATPAIDEAEQRLVDMLGDFARSRGSSLFGSSA